MRKGFSSCQSHSGLKIYLFIRFINKKWPVFIVEQSKSLGRMQRLARITAIWLSLLQALNLYHFIYFKQHALRAVLRDQALAPRCSSFWYLFPPDQWLLGNLWASLTPRFRSSTCSWSACQKATRCTNNNKCEKWHANIQKFNII